MSQDKKLIKLMREVVEVAPKMEDVINRASCLLEEMSNHGLNNIALCNHDYEIAIDNLISIGRHMDGGIHVPIKCNRCGHHAYLSPQKKKRARKTKQLSPKGDAQ